jgi:uncharacterized membrane protein YhfC
VSRNVALALIASILALIAGGCTTPHAPLDLVAPWADGEEATYDKVSPSGATTYTHRFTKTDSGWSFEYSTGGDGGRVELGPNGAPISAHHKGGDVELDVTYGDSQIALKSTKAGKPQPDATSPRYVDTLDAEEFFAALRGLPFDVGVERTFTYYAPGQNNSRPITATVLGTESVTVPAGTYDAWHVRVMLGDARDAWFSREAPHWLVKEAHASASAGSEYRLRDRRASKDATTIVSTDPPPAPPPPPKANVAFVLTALLVQAPLMILVPFFLIYLGRKKLDARLATAAAGAGTFIASQVVHLPFNYVSGLLGGRPPLGTLPLIPLCIAVGLSAGVCEEVARFIVMRFALKKDRAWKDGVMFGIGHGGVESAIFGGLALLGLVNVLLTPLSAEAMKTPGVKEQLATYWATVTPMASILAGVERLGAMSFHIGASVLVMRAVTRKNPAYLLLAIALHALLDGASVGMQIKGVGGIPLEGVGLAFGAAMIGLTFALRERPGEISTRAT